MIYSKNGERELNVCENTQNAIERRFTSEVCDAVCRALSISYGEERIVKALLINTIGKTISGGCRSEEGLLEQYMAYILDKASERIIKELSLSSIVNHNNALHAKFADIVKELSTKLNLIE